MTYLLRDGFVVYNLIMNQLNDDVFNQMVMGTQNEVQSDIPKQRTKISKDDTDAPGYVQYKPNQFGVATVNHQGGMNRLLKEA